MFPQGFIPLTQALKIRMNLLKSCKDRNYNLCGHKLFRVIATFVSVKFSPLCHLVNRNNFGNAS